MSWFLWPLLVFSFNSAKVFHTQFLDQVINAQEKAIYQTRGKLVFLHDPPPSRNFSRKAFARMSFPGPSSIDRYDPLLKKEES
jgi:hypothetical protein